MRRQYFDSPIQVQDWFIDDFDELWDIINTEFDSSLFDFFGNGMVENPTLTIDSAITLGIPEDFTYYLDGKRIKVDSATTTDITIDTTTDGTFLLFGSYDEVILEREETRERRLVDQKHKKIDYSPVFTIGSTADDTKVKIAQIVISGGTITNIDNTERDFIYIRPTRFHRFSVGVLASNTSSEYDKKGADAIYTSGDVNPFIADLFTNYNTVFLCDGEYNVISESIAIPSGKKLIGAGKGTILQTTNNINIVNMNSSYAELSNFRIINGGNLNSVNIDNANKSKIINLFIDGDTVTNGSNAININNSDNIYVYNVDCSEHNDGIYILDSNYITVKQSNIYDITNSGITLSSSTKCSLQLLHIDNVGVNGCILTGTASDNNLIHRLYITNATGDGIVIDNGSNNSIIGNYLTTNDLSFLASATYNLYFANFYNQLSDLGTGNTTSGNFSTL